MLHNFNVVKWNGWIVYIRNMKCSYVADFKYIVMCNEENVLCGMRHMQ